MTAAITALRSSFQGTTDVGIRRPSSLEQSPALQQQHRGRIIEEPHPELLFSRKEKHKEKLRYKRPSLPATIEDASEDDEEVNIFRIVDKLRQLAKNFLF